MTRALTLTLVTYNVGNGRSDPVSDRHVADDLAHLRTIADGIVLNEVRDRMPLLPARRWPVYQPTGQNREHNAITWNRRRLRIRHTDTTLLHDATRVGESGAGGPTLGAGWLHHIRVKPRRIGWRRLVVHILGLHMVPSVQGHAADALGRQLRRELYAEAVYAIRKRVARLHDPDVVAVGGDWNTTPEFHMNVPLVRAGLRVRGTVPPTRKGRAIDYWRLRWTARYEVDVEHFTIPLSSDHKASGVKLTIRRRK